MGGKCSHHCAIPAPQYLSLERKGYNQSIVHQVNIQCLWDEKRKECMSFLEFFFITSWSAPVQEMIAKMLLGLLSKPKGEKIVCCSLFKYWNENVISALFKHYGWPKISCDSSTLHYNLPFCYALHFQVNFLVARFKREFRFRPFWKRKSGSLRIAVQFPNPHSSPIFRYLSSGVSSRIFLPLEEFCVFSKPDSGFSTKWP